MKEVKTIMICFLLFLFVSCNCQYNTPEKYKNYSKANIETYTNHLAVLTDSIKCLIKFRQGPYYPKENDSSTKVFIDTILYSPDKSKIAFFVITRNSIDKLMGGGDKNKFHYDAHCFFGYLNKDFDVISINWFRSYNLSNYKTLVRASKGIRQIYFKEFIDKKSSLFKYNLDDKRFWNGPLWKD